MLGGAAPLFVLWFKVNPFKDTATILGQPLPDNLIRAAIRAIPGIPIPFYLGKLPIGGPNAGGFLQDDLSKIMVDSESRSIDIETKPVVTESSSGSNAGNKTTTKQIALQSVLSVQLVASQSNTLLTALLMSIDVALQLAPNDEYAVSYFNGPHLVMWGRLHGIATSTASTDDLVRVTIQISKIDEDLAPVNVVTVLPKITGATPV